MTPTKAAEDVLVEVSEEMEDAGCEAYDEAITAARDERKRRNDTYEAAGRERIAPETSTFPVDWLAPVYRAMRALDSEITTLLERERRKDAALDEAEAYLAAGAGWTNKDLENPIMARACGMGCREGLEKLRKARAALIGEG